MRECGDCSLCCKLLGVEELEKPERAWCKHCKPGKGGCQIYAERPQSCREFSCLWLVDKSIPDFMYPLKSRVVLAKKGDEIRAFSDTPGAWRKPKVFAVLKALHDENEF